jgi:integrase
MKFTKATVAALQLLAGKKDHIEFDEATPGFGVRIREGGSRTWVAQIRVDGQTRRLAIGSVAQIELEAARTAARKFFAEATLGGDPIKARQEARTRAATTVGAVIEKFLKAREHLRANSVRANERYLRRYFLPLHSRPIDSVTRREIAALVSDLAAKHGKVAAARARSALSAFYGWALKEGIATGESNPVTLTNDPAPHESPRDRILSPTEIRAIWHSLPRNSFGNVVRLLFLTGCRRIEVGSMEWSEVDFDKALLVIPGSKTKNHRTHRLPLVPEALDILKTIPRTNSAFVFGGSHGFTGFSYALTELRKCLAAVGHVTERWGPHDIRRTVRSEMGELGVEPWVGEQILNHARAGIEGTYNWAKLERQMRQALMLWADRLRSIIEGVESNVTALRA